MPRARVDAATKAAVIAHVREHGLDPAYETWPDLNRATIRSWCSRAGIATGGSERTRQMVEANRLRWEERRAGLCARMGEVAEKALTVVSDALDEGQTRKASDASAALARLVDKAQLLSGGSTARFGTDADRDRVLGEAQGQGLKLVQSA